MERAGQPPPATERHVRAVLAVLRTRAIAVDQPQHASAEAGEKDRT